MGGPFAELIDRHGARLFAFLKAGTSSEAAAASLFAETFRLLAKERVDLDPEADREVMLYRYALRVKNRLDVPAPDPRGALSRMFESVPAEDRVAFALLEASGLTIDRAANALRRPEPRLKEALAQALVRMTRAADPQLVPARDDATSDEMVAMAVFGWLTPEDRKVVEADRSAGPRRAAMKQVLAVVRELLSPCDPPRALLSRLDAAVQKSLQSAPEFVPAPPRRSSMRGVALALGALAVLAASGFGYLALRGDLEQEEAPAVVEESTPEPPPALAPASDSVEPPPAVEVAAQGPAAVDPRLEKATMHARKHRCKKAAHLLAKVVAEAPTNASAAKDAMAPCRGWLRKHRRDPKLAPLTYGK